MRLDYNWYMIKCKLDKQQEIDILTSNPAADTCMDRAVKINPAAAELVTQSSILFNINFSGDPVDIYTCSVILNTII